MEEGIGVKGMTLKRGETRRVTDGFDFRFGLRMGVDGIVSKREGSGVGGLESDCLNSFTGAVEGVWSRGEQWPKRTVTYPKNWVGRKSRASG